MASSLKAADHFDGDTPEGRLDSLIRECALQGAGWLTGRLFPPALLATALTACFLRQRNSPLFSIASLEKMGINAPQLRWNNPALSFLPINSLWNLGK